METNITGNTRITRLESFDIIDKKKAALEKSCLLSFSQDEIINLINGLHERYKWLFNEDIYFHKTIDIYSALTILNNKIYDKIGSFKLSNTGFVIKKPMGISNTFMVSPVYWIFNIKNKQLNDYLMYIIYLMINVVKLPNSINNRGPISSHLEYGIQTSEDEDDSELDKSILLDLNQRHFGQINRFKKRLNESEIDLKSFNAIKMPKCSEDIKQFIDISKKIINSHIRLDSNVFVCTDSDNGEMPWYHNLCLNWSITDDIWDSYSEDFDDIANNVGICDLEYESIITKENINQTVSVNEFINNITQWTDLMQKQKN